MHSLCHTKARGNTPVCKHHGTTFECFFIIITLLFSRCIFAGTVMPPPSPPPAAPPPSILDQYGNSELQKNTGGAVQTVCTRFGGGANVQNSLQRDLFDRCRELVQTSNDLRGAGPITDSLKLSAAELAAGLQQVTTEEAAAPGTLATESSANQLQNIGSRIQSLRTAAGFTSLGPRYGRESGGAAGDLLESSRLGVFVNGDFNTGDRDGSAREAGFDYDSGSVTGGVDYRFSDQFVAGVAIGHNRSDIDFKFASTVAGGSIKSTGYSVSGYGSYSTESFYIDAIVTYGRNDIDIDRRIVYATQNRTGRGSTESDELTASIAGGLNLSSGAWTYGPYARLTRTSIEIDAYTETGAAGLGLSVDKQNIDALTTALGIQVSYASSQDFGILVPHLRGEWNHELDDNARTITARYTNEFIPAGGSSTNLTIRTDAPDRNYFTFGAGVSGVLPDGIQGFLDYEVTVGLKRVTDHLISGGMRFEF